MSNFTRRFKKYKNKNIKKGGNRIVEEPQREGIIDKVGHNLSDATSGLVSNTENAVDKTGAVILNNVNEVLGSDAAKQATEQAAKDTAKIIKVFAEKFNEALDDPEVKAEVKQAIKNAGELGMVVAEAAKEPVNRALNNTAESIERTMPKLGAAGVKTLWDAVGAVPPLNIVIEGINVVNNLTKAASAVSEATTEAIESASNAFIETKNNIEMKLKDLEEKKKISNLISNRTTNSIRDFEGPVTAQTGGGYKTRRRLFKNKAKSKRVRFAI